MRILTTAYSELDQTVEAVNQGQIHRYIKKPWDITALRMELKQALELAGLREERDQLLREKLSVLQKQTVATRVGMVQALCASLIGPGRFQPVETYLAGTSLAGARNAEPDWQRLDYADLVGAESQRSGTFGHAVGKRLAELRGRLAGKGAADAVAVLAETLGDGAVRRDGDAVTWLSPAALGEFVGNPVGEAVSAGHADWLAVLPPSGSRRLAAHCGCSAKAMRSRHVPPCGRRRSPRTASRCGSSSCRTESRQSNEKRRPRAPFSFPACQQPSGLRAEVRVVAVVGVAGLLLALDQVLALHAQPHRQRRSHEHRRIDTEQDAHRQGQREVMRASGRRRRTSTAPSFRSNRA